MESWGAWIHAEHGKGVLNEHAQYKRGVGRPENGARTNNLIAKWSSRLGLVYIIDTCTKTPVGFKWVEIERIVLTPIARVIFIFEKYGE